MTTPTPRLAHPADGPSIQIGALVPLTRPGWTEAGRHLLAGLELAARDINNTGGIAGKPLELIVRDTAADPHRPAAAVDELAHLGVTALAGEYHSVFARAAAIRADALGVPYLCSSAVLDTLTEQPTKWVARLSPPQSRGWQTYADFLLSAGHTHIAVAAEPSLYWASGTRILRDHLTGRGASVTELDMRTLTPTAVCDVLANSQATALLLLVGHPDPAVPIVKAARADQSLSSILIGAPAGQPEFTEWVTLLGHDGAAIPFLRYLPGHLTPSEHEPRRPCANTSTKPPPSSPLRATTRSPSSRNCCGSTARTGTAQRHRGRTSQSKAPADRYSSAERQASASGSGPGHPSRSSTEIQRNPTTSGSFTRAEPTQRPSVQTGPNPRLPT